MRRLALSSLVLAALLTATAATAQPAATVRAETNRSGNYWVMLTMPNRSIAPAVLLIEDHAGVLTGTLIVQGSEAVLLEKVELANGELTADLPTTGGPARLEIHLESTKGIGSLALLPRHAVRADVKS